MLMSADSTTERKAASESASRSTAVAMTSAANGLALSDHVRAEQVELDFPGDVGDAGLAGFAGGEVAGFLGFPRAGPAGPVADEESGYEDLQQERGEGQI
jgi:hypothetical protein